MRRREKRRRERERERQKRYQPSVTNVEKVPADLFVSIVSSSSWFLNGGVCSPPVLAFAATVQVREASATRPSDLQPTALNEIEQSCLLGFQLQYLLTAGPHPHLTPLYRYPVNQRRKSLAFRTPRRQSCTANFQRASNVLLRRTQPAAHPPRVHGLLSRPATQRKLSRSQSPFKNSTN